MKRNATRSARSNTSHFRVLVIGNSGAGKSYLANYFKKRGLPAIDMDAHTVSGWFDEVKKTWVRDYDPKTWNYESKMAWNWKSRILKKLLKRKELYAFGSAANREEFFKYFDRIYYLNINKKLLIERLKKRKHSFGKTNEQVKLIASWTKLMRNEAIKYKMEIIDGSLPPKIIFEIIKSKK